MSQKESKHADTLRSLGFVKVESTLPRKLVRRLIRDSRKGNVMPSFSRNGFITRATDEVGQTWETNGTIDLSHLGFRDNIAWFGNVHRGR